MVSGPGAPAALRHSLGDRDLPCAADRASTTPPWLATARRLARLSCGPGNPLLRADRSRCRWLLLPSAVVALPAEADPARRRRPRALARTGARPRRVALRSSRHHDLRALLMTPRRARRPGLRRERDRACTTRSCRWHRGPTYADIARRRARARHGTTPSGLVWRGPPLRLSDSWPFRRSRTASRCPMIAGSRPALPPCNPAAALDSWAVSAADGTDGVRDPPGGRGLPQRRRPQRAPAAAPPRRPDPALADRRWRRSIRRSSHSHRPASDARRPPLARLRRGGPSFRRGRVAPMPRAAGPRRHRTSPRIDVA